MTGTDLATWVCVGIEAGMVDKTCVEACAASCGTAVTGADICNSAGMDGGIAAGTCVCIEVWAAVCAGAGTGAATWVCAGIKAGVGAKLGI